MKEWSTELGLLRNLSAHHKPDQVPPALEDIKGSSDSSTNSSNTSTRRLTKSTNIGSESRAIRKVLMQPFLQLWVA